MIKQKLALLPDEPGCYQMKDKENNIIYVGKAKSLKNRVKQYFTGVHDFKTQRLVNEITDFEYIITQSEKDALLLEINLIKEYHPKYNIALKDGKTYPYIKLDVNQVPLLSITRNLRSKKAQYFGPFPNVKDAKATIQLLNKIYALYESRYLMEKESTSYEKIESKGKYRFQYRVNDDIVLSIQQFLKGDTKQVELEIKRKMQQYADALEFEKAQKQLELLHAIQHVVSKNQVQLQDKKDKDLIHFYSENGYMCVLVFLLRNGKLIERNFKVFDIYESINDAFISFVFQYYQDNVVPKEIYLPHSIDSTLLQETLQTKILQPIKGEKLKILLNVQENAKKQLENHFQLAFQSEKSIEVWNELQKTLQIQLSHIEVFDNSHLSSTHNVSGMIYVENGEFQKKQYRHFKLENYISDLHSMKEVIYRRYFRALMEERKLPSVIFVDGGLLQIQAAIEVLHSLDLNIPVFGLVKDEKHRSAALMNAQGTIIAIDKKSALFFFLTRIQDEVHRYAIQFHRKIRSKAMVKSFLDDIPGLGSVRKDKLLRVFKSVKNIKEASYAKLCEVVPKDVAKNIMKAIEKENLK